jgi:pimeloyl-ACP methyl ester carboxylesterase
VIPDRPGCHGSTSNPGRTVADWPADHLAPMDALGVDRFGIVTQSGGTPYGIALAGAVPERVTAHSLLGAMAPLAEKAQRRAAGKDMKMAAFMSRRAPFLLWAGFKQQYKKLPDSAIGLLEGPDAEVVQIPWVKDLFVLTTGELFANPNGFIEEVRILCKPWRITPWRGPRLPLDW